MYRKHTFNNTSSGFCSQCFILKGKYAQSTILRKKNYTSNNLHTKYKYIRIQKQIAEQIHWIAIDCTVESNKVKTECI